MPSDAQIRANRNNALRSTGPRTPHGKSRSRFNATRHGLTAQHVVLPVEDYDAYQQLRADLIGEFTPQSPSEGLLVDLFVQAAWRINRSRRYETGMLSNLEEESTTKCPTALDLDHHRRYEGAISRDFYRAYDRLQRVMRKRPPAPPEGEEGFSPESDEPVQISEKAAVESVGFVSHGTVAQPASAEPEIAEEAVLPQPQACSPLQDPVSPHFLSHGNVVNSLPFSVLGERGPNTTSVRPRVPLPGTNG